MTVFGQVKAVILRYCLVVRGATILGIAVLLLATPTTSMTTTTLLVFGLYVVVRRGLSSPLYSCTFALCSYFLYPSKRSGTERSKKFYLKKRLLPAHFFGDKEVERGSGIQKYSTLGRQ